MLKGTFTVIVLCTCISLSFSMPVYAERPEHFNLATREYYSGFAAMLNQCAFYAGLGNLALKIWFETKAYQALMAAKSAGQEGPVNTDTSLKNAFSRPFSLGSNLTIRGRIPLRNTELETPALEKIHEMLLSSAELAAEVDLELMLWFLDQDLRIIKAIEDGKILKIDSQKPYFVRKIDPYHNHHLVAHAMVMAHALERGQIVERILNEVLNGPLIDDGSNNLIAMIEDFIEKRWKPHLELLKPPTMYVSDHNEFMATLTDLGIDNNIPLYKRNIEDYRQLSEVAKSLP